MQVGDDAAAADLLAYAVMAVLVSLVVVLGLGLALAALRGMGARRPVGDEVTYMENAARSDPYAPGSFVRMPFMAWLAARCRTPAGEGRLRALMALVSVLTVAVTTVAGWHLGGGLVAGLAAFLLLFQPERIVLACHIWPDGLLALMAAAVAWLLLLPSASGAFLWLALGSACAIGSLVRIDFLVVLPVVWVSLEATGRSGGFAGAALLAAPTVAVVVGWTIHNARSYGLFVPDDTWTFNLMVAEAQLARRGSASLDPEAVLKETFHHWAAVPIAERPRRAVRSLAVLLGSPGRFLSDVARRAVALCGPDTFIRQNLLPCGYPELSASWRRRLEWPLRLAFPLLIALAALGILLSRVPAASAFAWPSLGLMGVSALFFARTRLRLALLPALSLLAAQGVVAAAGWLGAEPGMLASWSPF